MTVIVCVEDRFGQAFHHRRLSRDRQLCQRVLDRLEGRPISMSPYSRGLFGEGEGASFVVSEEYLEQAGQGDICFVELDDLRPCWERIDRIILYRWNRTYPFDLAFPDITSCPEWRLASVCQFEGHSHPIITEEIYEKT